MLINRALSVTELIPYYYLLVVAPFRQEIHFITALKQAYFKIRTSSLKLGE
jgi:hypothetical protein